MNSIDICNLALGLVGVDRGIESLSDDSPEARYCSRFYDHIRETMLHDHPWRWATRREILAELSNDVDGWEYVYSYPSDCLKALAVEDAEHDPAMLYEHEIRKLDGSVIAVCCDVYQAYLRYTANVEDANLFSPSFVEALAQRLGSRLALSLTGQRDVVQALGQEADRTLARAKMLDASEGYRVPNISNSYISARTA